MLRVEAHGDVTRLILSSRASRLVGYDVSAYLVDTPGGRVLVDTGFPAAWGDLRAYLRTLGGGDVARALRGAVVTHAHEDHAGNAGRLAAAGVPLAMGKATRVALSTAGRLPLYRRFVWGRMRPVPIDWEALAGGAFRPAPLALVRAPGHSPDHRAVWDPRTRTLFGGDLFLGVRVRVAHPGENLHALARSLRAAAALRPFRLFDAHRGLVRDPVASLQAKAAWVEDTVAEVERLLDRGWPAWRVRRAVLGREEFAAYLSLGEYSRGGFVRAVRDRRERRRRNVTTYTLDAVAPQPSTANSRSASRS
jgi:glyoxylase-like metal-dependent hydrolase (beta-lactamase superfamily II)